MANNQGLAEHHAAVTVNAPVHQVYGLFTHFNDFPKFMSFVKEVTYYDDQRSHWVAQVAGQHEWDAVNDNWMEDRQVGWHSTNGLENYGKVTFQPMGNNQTQVDVYVNYNPPAGVLGDIGENLGVGGSFQSKLQHDMDNFAQMVDQAPPGALDPNSSNYLFHAGSAAAKGTTTDRQDATMGDTHQNSANYGTYTNDRYASGNNANTAFSGDTADNNATGSNMNTGTTGNYATSGAAPQTRPTLDSDIISGNTGTNYAPNQGANNPNQGMMQQNTGTTVYTPDRGQGTVPNNTGTNYPQGQDVNTTDQEIMPPDSRTRNPVMPPETGTSNPVMPPENDNNY